MLRWGGYETSSDGPCGLRGDRQRQLSRCLEASRPSRPMPAWSAMASRLRARPRLGDDGPARTGRSCRLPIFRLPAAGGAPTHAVGRTWRSSAGMRDFGLRGPWVSCSTRSRRTRPASNHLDVGRGASPLRARAASCGWLKVLREADGRVLVTATQDGPIEGQQWVGCGRSASAQSRQILQ
jgi:hypothetical protein